MAIRDWQSDERREKNLEKGRRRACLSRNCWRFLSCAPERGSPLPSTWRACAHSFLSLRRKLISLRPAAILRREAGLGLATICGIAGVGRESRARNCRSFEHRSFPLQPRATRRISTSACAIWNTQVFCCLSLESGNADSIRGGIVPRTIEAPRAPTGDRQVAMQRNFAGRSSSRTIIIAGWRSHRRRTSSITQRSEALPLGHPGAEHITWATAHAALADVGLIECVSPTVRLSVCPADTVAVTSPSPPA